MWQPSSSIRSRPTVTEMNPGRYGNRAFQKTDTRAKTPVGYFVDSLCLLCYPANRLRQHLLPESFQPITTKTSEHAGYTVLSTAPPSGFGLVRTPAEQATARIAVSVPDPRPCHRYALRCVPPGRRGGKTKKEASGGAASPDSFD